MRYEFKASFDRAVRKLTRIRRAHVAAAADALIDFSEGGPRPDGLGLKQLRKPFWEMRASRSDRVLFAFEDDLIVFLIAGTHDEIRRFLKDA